MPTDAVAPEPFGTKKFIGRRCAMELVPNAVVNLGVGIPEKVATVAGEEGFADQLTLTTESGMIGGVQAAAAPLVQELTVGVNYLKSASLISMMAADLMLHILVLRNVTLMVTLT